MNWWSYYSFFIFTQRRKDAKIFFNGNTDYTDWTDLHGFFLTTNSLILYELIRFKFVHSWSYYSFFCLPRMHEFFFLFLFLFEIVFYICVFTFEIKGVVFVPITTTLILIKYLFAMFYKNRK